MNECDGALVLEARNIHKVYHNGLRELSVLKGVQLQIRKGEVLSIVGPSGAGKSTLLHILGGLDEPTGGEVFFEGVSLSSLDDVRRAGIRNARFGFVFQFYHLLRELSAIENVMMPAMIGRPRQGQRQLHDKALGLLTFLGLSGRTHHKPTQLSGGEQQRVAIARALINDPDVLFCDEPTGNLDHETGLQIRRMLKTLNQERAMTMVIVTHSPEVAEDSHKTLNIFDGQILS